MRTLFCFVTFFVYAELFSRVIHFGGVAPFEVADTARPGGPSPHERLATQTPEMGLGDAGSFGTPVGTPESTPLPSGAPRCRS